METEDNYKRRLVKARKRVDSIKKFYRHLRIFIVVNIVLLFLKFRALDYFDGNGFLENGTPDWFEWNLIGTPAIWGFGLGLHAIYVFVLEAKPLKELGSRLTKEWEDRKIEEFMNEDETRY